MSCGFWRVRPDVCLLLRDQ